MATKKVEKKVEKKETKAPAKKAPEPKVEKKEPDKIQNDNHEALVALATELNDVFGLDGSTDEAIPIKTEDVSTEDLIKEINSTFKELANQDDEFSEQAIKTLALIGLELPKQEETEPESPEPEKKAGKKTSAKKAGAPKKESGPSNKLTVYKAWKSGTTDVDALLKLVKDAVQKGTVTGWISTWKKGTNLPAGA